MININQKWTLHQRFSENPANHLQNAPSWIFDRLLDKPQCTSLTNAVYTIRGIQLSMCLNLYVYIQVDEELRVVEFFLS